MRRRDMPKDITIKKINPSGYLVQRIRDGRSVKDAYNDLRNHLKRRLIGKCATFSVLGKDRLGAPEVHRAGHWWIDDIYKKESELGNGNVYIQIVGHGFHRDNKETYDVRLYLKDDIEYEDKIIISPLDPWGEEDWETNENKREIFDQERLKKVQKIFKAGDRVIGIGKAFKNVSVDGIRGTLDNDPYYSKDGNIYCTVEFDNDICWNMRIEQLRKPKAIHSPMDPWGEEDWENEQISEEYWWEDKTDPPIFKIGDLIEANGEIGMRTFRQDIGTVVRIQDGVLTRSDMHKGNYNNKKDSRYYSGIIYRVDFGEGDVYWISPWNMKSSH